MVQDDLRWGGGGHSGQCLGGGASSPRIKGKNASSIRDFKKKGGFGGGGPPFSLKCVSGDGRGRCGPFSTGGKI